MCEIEYDQYGRMKYNPEYHENNGKPWTEEELEYLVKWYNMIGLEEMSLALGRTMGTVNNKVRKMRREGLMETPEVQIRTKKETHIGVRTFVRG